MTLRINLSFAGAHQHRSSEYIVTVDMSSATPEIPKTMKALVVVPVRSNGTYWGFLYS